MKTLTHSLGFSHSMCQAPLAFIQTPYRQESALKSKVSSEKHPGSTRFLLFNILFSQNLIFLVKKDLFSWFLSIFFQLPLPSNWVSNLAPNSHANQACSALTQILVEKGVLGANPYGLWLNAIGAQRLTARTKLTGWLASLDWAAQAYSMTHPQPLNSVPPCLLWRIGFGRGTIMSDLVDSDRELPVNLAIINKATHGYIHAHIHKSIKKN